MHISKKYTGLRRIWCPLDRDENAGLDVLNCILLLPKVKDARTLQNSAISDARWVVVEPYSILLIQVFVLGQLKVVADLEGCL